MRDNTIGNGYRCAVWGIIYILMQGCSRQNEQLVQSPMDSLYDYHSSWDAGLATYRETWPADFHIGRDADEAFIAKWDIDVRPDGKGLPKEGKGTAQAGAVIYQKQCASCHGIHGYEGPYDKLVTDSTGKNTIGNYWPYATTIFDYVRRAMPFNAPGSLSDQEVYDITAYLLYLNKITPEDAVIDANSLPTIEMPARKRYIVDDRKGGNEIK